MARYNVVNIARRDHDRKQKMNGEKIRFLLTLQEI
jgi:hypothetical protein